MSRAGKFATDSTGSTAEEKETGLQAEHYVLGRLVASDPDSSNILLQLWSSDASGQSAPAYLIFDLDEVVECRNKVGDNSMLSDSKNDGKLPYSLLPRWPRACESPSLSFHGTD